MSLAVSYCHVECHYDECRYAKCRYSEYRYSENRGTLSANITQVGSLQQFFSKYSVDNFIKLFCGVIYAPVSVLP